MFVWKKNGEVELIPEEFKSGTTDPISRKINDDDEVVVNQEFQDAMEQIEENRASVPAIAKLQIQVPTTQNLN